MSIVLYLIIFIFLLALSAFCSGSESSLFSLSRLDVQRISIKNKTVAQHIADLLKTPGSILIAILITNMVVNISATTMMTGILLRIFGGSGVLLSVVVMTSLILVFGEILPKVVAVEYNVSWANKSAYMLKFLRTITTPFRVILQVVQTIAIGGREEEDLRLGDIDIRSALELAHREGALESQSKELLLHVLSLDRVSVSEIMTPLANLHIFSDSAQREEVFRFFQNRDEDFVIVDNEKLEHPRILRREAILNDLDDKSISYLSEEPYFVHEKKTLSSLFADIVAQGMEKDIVVIDAHGIIVGAVHRQKILQTVFSEPISREKISQKHFSRIGDFLLIPATITLNQFNDVFDSAFESKHSNTIAGFLTEVFGDIPKTGITIDVQGFRFRIISATSRKILRIAVKRIEG